jgi:hypothetical protein
MGRPKGTAAELEAVALAPEKEAPASYEVGIEKAGSLSEHADLAALAAQYNARLSKRDIIRREKGFLYGREALEFLGLPVRAYFEILAGPREDFYRLSRMAKPMFEAWAETSGDDGLREDVDFWDNIKLRVWDERSIESYLDDAVTILGRQGASFVSDDGEVVAARYDGYITSGSQFSAVAPNRRSTNAKTYVVQMHSVRLTDAMKEFQEYKTYRTYRNDR